MSSFRENPAAPFAGAVAMAILLFATAHCGDDEAAAPDTQDAAPDAANDARRGDGGSEDAGPASLPTEGSGTRFRTIHTLETFDDGTKRRLFFGFFDRELGHPCGIREVGPDRFACLPDDLVTAGEEVGFSDPACTKPAIAVPDVEPGRYVRWGPRCAPKLGVMGAKVGTTLYEKDPATEECKVTRIGTPTLDVPSEIAVDAFGVFTRTSDPTAYPGEKSGSRLELVVDRFDGSDGSFEARAPRIVDRVRNAWGEIAFAADEKRRLLTTFGRVDHSSQLFADDACATGVVGFERDAWACGDDPRRPRDARSADRSCAVAHVFTRPAQPPLSAVYESVDATCRAAVGVPNAAGDLYPEQPLTEVPPQSFAEVAMQIVPATLGIVSGTALEGRARRYTSADGLDLALREASLYLRQWDVPCVVTSTGPSVSDAACVPDVPLADAGSADFADAACTQRLLPLLGGGACGEPAPRFFKTSDGSVYPLSPAEVLRPANVSRRESGECVAAAASASAYVEAKARVPIPPETFPARTKVDAVIDR